MKVVYSHQEWLFMVPEVVDSNSESKAGFEARRIPRRKFLPFLKDSNEAPKIIQHTDELDIDLIAEKLFGSYMPRRGLLKAGAITTGAVMLGPRATEIAFRVLPIPEEYPIPFLKPTEEERPIFADIAQILPGDLDVSTLAHRAGNSRHGIRSAAGSKFTHADLDISIDYDGKMYAYHGDIREAAGFKVGIDEATATFNISPQPLEEAFELAEDVGIGLAIEVKERRGGMPTANMMKISWLAEHYNTPVIFFSTNLPWYVDIARRVMGDAVTCLDTVRDDGQLKNFLKKDIKGDRAFFADTDLIVRNQDLILQNGLSAYATGVHTRKQVDSLLACGAKGMGNDAQVLQRAFYQTT